MTRSRLLLLAVLGLALAGAGAFYFVGRDVPEAVDLERAIAAVPATDPATRPRAHRRPAPRRRTSC
jgi:hypothetical protein